MDYTKLSFSGSITEKIFQQKNSRREVYEGKNPALTVTVKWANPNNTTIESIELLKTK